MCVLCVCYGRAGSYGYSLPHVLRAVDGDASVYGMACVAVITHLLGVDGNTMLEVAIFVMELVARATVIWPLELEVVNTEPG